MHMSIAAPQLLIQEHVEPVRQPVGPHVVQVRGSCYVKQAAGYSGPKEIA